MNRRDIHVVPHDGGWATGKERAERAGGDSSGDLAVSSWFRLVERSKFADFGALKRTFGAADYVAPFTIFDVGGNKYRVITAIHYNRQCVYIRHVFTHPEYDRWSGEMRSKKRRKRGK